jgi:transposase
MSKGQSRDPRKEQFWRDHLKRWGASGRTIRDYCAKHRLSEPSFYAWRRTVAQRGRTADVPPDEPAVTFLPVQVQADLPVPSPVLELVLANGRLLRIPPGVDPGHVRDLLAILEAEPC